MEIKEILSQQNFRYNKQFGQNFIYDENLLAAIVKDAKVDKDDYCLEIGAGAGTLTKQLSLCCKKVLSFEIDKNLKEVLLTQKIGDNVEFVFEDFLKCDISALEEKISQPYKVVANLPYYITTPLIMTFVEKSKNCQSLTVMVQKEVAERLSSLPNCKQYGAVTVAVQSVADTNLCRIVPAAVFVPRPEVDSALINIVFNRQKHNIENPAKFRKIVKAAFSMRRKTLENNLLNAFSLSRAEIQKVISECGFSPSIRGEALSVSDFIKLSEKFPD